MPLIELDRVCFSWPDSPRPALDNLSFAIAEGEYVAVVGANGSGKSSLLRLLNALKIPVSGELKIDGLSTSLAEGLRAARAAVGLVFQSPADQIVSSSVEEDVAFGPENLGLARPEIARRVADALAAVGLAGQGRRASHFLSAGQQQRLAVAGALAMDARCIAFDEATAMLDPEARLRVLALMDGLVASGKTVIHVTHDMSEAALASRVLVLDRGTLVFDGPPAALFSRAGAPRGAIADLGLPECVELAVALGLEPRIRETAAALAARIAARRSGRNAGGAQPDGAANGGNPAGAAACPAFELKGASHAYLRGTLNETAALRDIDLSLPARAVVAFVGRTGSGKSTALQLLDGLVAPVSGCVRSLGLELSDPKTDLRSVRMRAPLCIQRPESALFEPYSGDDVAFGPRNLGLSGVDLVARVRRSMEDAGLGFEAFRDRRTRSLSGGEKRRLALAGVLAMEGDALLLDEPTSGLDPATRISILDLVLGASRRDATVVLATHSMEAAARADLVVVFDEGRIAASGDPETIFYDLFDPGWGLGRPFACEVAVELRALGPGFEGRPLSIRALASALEAAP